MGDNKNLVRCFIALELSRGAIQEIENIQSLIKKKNLFLGKFTEPENLHLTLKFIGELSEEKINEVRKKLKGIKFKEFEVSLGEVGIFINLYNSILWVKLNGESIWGLQKQIDDRLAGLFESEARFMSHITIARMKKIYDKKEFLKYVKSIKHKPIKFLVKEFILKKSELFEEGPVYSDLEKYESEN